MFLGIMFVLSTVQVGAQAFRDEVEDSLKAFSVPPFYCKTLMTLNDTFAFPKILNAKFNFIYIDINQILTDFFLTFLAYSCFLLRKIVPLHQHCERKLLLY